MRVRRPIVVLLLALPLEAVSAETVINNGLAPPNPANVIDYSIPSSLYVRNVGCPPG
jgi:hypothetical protein